MQCRIRSLYLCVKDIRRAVAFYERLFERPVTEKDAVYSVFDIGGFRLGLFAYETKGEPHTFGSNCLPSIEVDDFDALLQKLKELGSAIVFPPTVIRNNRVLECVDSEGNHIEITAKIKP